jgi:hypothetical protein
VGFTFLCRKIGRMCGVFAYEQVQHREGKLMKRFTIFVATAAGALSLAAVSLADPGDHGKQKQGHAKFTFTMTTTDNGCNSNPWATDTETRTYSVKDNGDGTFRVRRSEKGTFTTLAAQSPGDCGTGKHGTAVVAGIQGKFQGYLVGTVTATSFNPNATCAAGADCSSRAGFIATYFAAGATYSCDQDSTDCKFNFNYTAKAKGDAQKKLLYRHWQDKGKGAGTLLKERFHGDIATS